MKDRMLCTMILVQLRIYKDTVQSCVLQVSSCKTPKINQFPREKLNEYVRKYGGNMDESRCLVMR